MKKFVKCPFCGEDLEEKIYERFIGGLFHIYCYTCGARGPDSLTVIGATNQWNNRSESEDES